MTKSKRGPAPPLLEQPLTREIRSAIADDFRTPYALARDAGLDEASLRRFLSRERSLSLESADRLAVALGLAVVRKAKGRKPARPPVRPADEPEAGLLAEATDLEKLEVGESPAPGPEGPSGHDIGQLAETTLDAGVVPESCQMAGPELSVGVDVDPGLPVGEC